LGCGDGIILLFAAKKYGLRGIGYDINEQLIKVANNLIINSELSNLISCELRSFMDESLDFAKLFKSDGIKPEQTTLITVYLIPDALKLLKPKLEEYLLRAKHNYNLDVKVLSIIFSIPGWKPIKTGDQLDTYVYDLSSIS